MKTKRKGNRGKSMILPDFTGRHVIYIRRSLNFNPIKPIHLDLQIKRYDFIIIYYRSIRNYAYLRAGDTNV